MLAVAWIVVSVVVGAAMGTLIRIGFAETTPERYRERWGVRPMKSAILITVCFVLYLTALVAALAGIDLGGFESVAIIAPWGAAAIAVCLPAVWRLATADLRYRPPS